MEKPTAGPEHRWLQRMLGDWRWESEPMAEPGKTPSIYSGTDHVRSLGDVWIVSESDGGVPGGGKHQNMMSLGYDPARGRFVGTFIASMMTHLWVYEGALDASGAALVLDTSGPSFAGDGTTAPYRDSITFVSDDHRVLRSKYQAPDGTWSGFMVAHYHRTTSR